MENGVAQTALVSSVQAGTATAVAATAEFSAIAVTAGEMSFVARGIVNALALGGIVLAYVNYNNLGNGSDDQVKVKEFTDPQGNTAVEVSAQIGPNTQVRATGITKEEKCDFKNPSQHPWGIREKKQWEHVCESEEYDNRRKVENGERKTSCFENYQKAVYYAFRAWYSGKPIGGGMKMADFCPEKVGVGHFGEPQCRVRVSMNEKCLIHASPWIGGSVPPNK